MQNILSKYAKILRGQFSKEENVTPMKIELIPVLEIIFSNDDVLLPQQLHYLDRSELWDDFYAKQHLLAGLTDKLTPYSKGIPYYELSSISDDNLAVFIVKGIEDMEEADFGSDDATLFQGGYVLRVSDEDIFFPQCCSDLSEITAWQELVTDAPCCFYQGHPSPTVKKEGNKIILDFEEDLGGETFFPAVNSRTVVLEKQALKDAIPVAIQKVNAFSERLERVNIEKQLGIKNIDKAFFIKS